MDGEIINASEAPQALELPTEIFPWRLLRNAFLLTFLCAMFTPNWWPIAVGQWLWTTGGVALLPFAAELGFASGPIARLAVAAQLDGDLHRLEPAERLVYLIGILATVFRLRGMGSSAGSTLEARDMLQALAPLELALALYMVFSNPNLAR